MEAGISPNIEDLEGNTALHVKCYGETDRPSDSATIAALINARANITLRSKKVAPYKFYLSHNDE